MFDEDYEDEEPTPVDAAEEGAEAEPDEAEPDEAEPDEDAGPVEEPESAQAAPESDGPDPWAEFRGDNGKILGRYDTAEAALKALHEVDAERGRLANELGQLRQQRRPEAPPDDPDPVAEVQRLVMMPPEAIAVDMPEYFRSYCTAPVEQGGMGWSEDQVDMLTEAGVARVQQRMEGQLHQIWQMREHEQTQQQELIHRAREEFLSNHADVAPWADVLLDAAADAVVSAGNPPADKAAFDAAVADQMRAMLAERGVALQGQAAPKRAVPPAPTSPARAPSTAPSAAGSAGVGLWDD